MSPRFYIPLLRLSVVAALFATICGGLASLVQDPAIAFSAEPAPGRAGQTGTAPGQRITFERISIEQGLSQSSVNCVYQDSKGYMWFGTQDGLNRYDGYGFTVYRSIPGRNSLAFNFVRAICEDSAGTLWIATQGGGLDGFDRETEQFAHYQADPKDPYSLNNDFATSIYADSSDVLWIGTHGGLARFDPETKRFDRYRHAEGDPDSLSNDLVWSVFRDREGVLWVGTEDGLNRKDPGAQGFVHYRNAPGDPFSLSGNSVQAITQDREGVLWVGTNNGLNRFDPQRERFVRYQHALYDPGTLSDSSVWAITQDREGVLWVGTEDGLNRFDRETERFARYRNERADPGSLSSNWIWSIYQDREGALWVGTYYGGVNKYDRFAQRFAHYQAPPDDASALNSDQVRSFAEDQEGALWIGTIGGGLVQVDRQTGAYTHYRHDPRDPYSLSQDVVRAVLVDHEGVLWAGTEDAGLNRFDRQSGRFIRYQHDPDDPRSLSDDAIRVLFEDREGAIWIGTYGGGFNRFDRQGERFTRYLDAPRGLSGASVWSMAQDRDGTLWVGTSGAGLYEFDRDQERFTRYPLDSASTILAIHQDRRGDLWLGTFGNGLCRFDPGGGGFTPYREEDGLSSNVVYGILEDDQGCLWLSTNNGVSRFDPQAEVFRNYDVSDGLQSKEFNAGAWYESSSGEMFFGGVDGFNAFYPDRVGADNAYVPPVVLTSLTRGGEPLDVEGAVDSVEAFTLNWPDNSFEFEFAALSYSKPEKNRYAYMLEGFDQDWLQVGTSRLGKYTNLPGGTYTLRIRGSNGDGVWNEEGTSVTVTVVPPFWDTWPFRIVVLVVLAVVAVGLYRQRIRNIRARSQELEAQVAQRTAELRQEIEQRLQVEEALRQSEMEKAVAAERSRLARDLHDAVTQTLFSASLIAEALPAMWDSDPEEGRLLLQELRQLSRGALAEMRTLLLELRPAALLETSPGDLLRQLGEAVTGRTGVPVTVAVEGSCALPPDVHVALYRIAQEALHNAVKHAQASQVTVRLCCVPPTEGREGAHAELQVRDDGRGFDPGCVPPDRLGLGIMRERAQAIGAALEIESQPGQGTRIAVAWKGEGR